LPKGGCIYFGSPDDEALLAERLYIGFWTDKGACDVVTKDFLAKVQGKFEKILQKTSREMGKSNTLVGTYMCQGKMPMSVRERYEKMLAAPVHAPNLKGMIENYDRALSHPDKNDLIQLKKAVME